MLLSVKADMSKIQKIFVCFIFSFPLVLQYCSYVFVFNIPYFLIAQQLENVRIQCPLSLAKSRDTYTALE